MDEKDKKIIQQRNLLAAAKSKIQQLKLGLQAKDKQIVELKANYQLKSKNFDFDTGQVIKQYEQRLARYQKSLQESQDLKAKYQAQAITNSRVYETMTQGINQIGNITMRIFTLNKAVQQLCNIQKCKQFLEQLEKIQKKDEIGPALKSITKLTELYSQNLHKKREARMIFTKKQSQLKKSLEEQQQRHKQQSRKISDLQLQIKKTQSQWSSKLEEINKSKMKMSEQMANLQFIKQLLLKIFIGPKEASYMALQVLAKVLKMDAQEIKICTRKLK